MGSKNYISANDLDISFEPDAGRGPVDFKVSRGGDKTIVEIKLSTNTQYLHGYEEQVEEYGKAECTDKMIYGICRICGENKELTFEHVPPETVFNKGAVRNVTLDAVIKDTVKENKLPWEINYGKGKIKQRGRGGFYLCGDCNSCTGQWYVPEYSRFVMPFRERCGRLGNRSMNCLA